MIYRRIEYQVRSSLGRNEWVILIYYPDKADGKATVAKFRGTMKERATRLVARLILDERSEAEGAIATTPGIEAGPAARFPGRT